MDNDTIEMMNRQGRRAWGIPEPDTGNPYHYIDFNGSRSNKYPEFQIWEDGRQAGMKELAEWLSARLIPMYSRDVPEVLSYYNLQPRVWLAKLKEMG